MFKKNPKIKEFLILLVSPKDTKTALETKLIIIKIVPMKIILIYSTAKAKGSPFAPINSNMYGAQIYPIIAEIKAIILTILNPLWAYNLACLALLEPDRFPSKAVMEEFNPKHKPKKIK